MTQVHTDEFTNMGWTGESRGHRNSALDSIYVNPCDLWGKQSSMEKARRRSGRESYWHPHDSLLVWVLLGSLGFAEACLESVAAEREKQATGRHTNEIPNGQSESLWNPARVKPDQPRVFEGQFPRRSHGFCSS